MLAEVRGGTRRRIDLDVATELRPVVAELNALIDANHAALERARGHVANLAHGLKTPLAALRLDLPAHDSAFATTVHKAQGSEFDRVAVVLPDDDARVLSRELLYTALTRARHGALLWSPESVLLRAIARHTRRASGLVERLASASRSDG